LLISRTENGGDEDVLAKESAGETSACEKSSHRKCTAEEDVSERSPGERSTAEEVAADGSGSEKCTAVKSPPDQSAPSSPRDSSRTHAVASACLCLV
jgi:hypothetical protein